MGRREDARLSFIKSFAERDMIAYRNKIDYATAYRIISKRLGRCNTGSLFESFSIPHSVCGKV